MEPYGLVVGILTGSLIVALIAAGAVYLLGSFVGSLIDGEVSSGQEISGVDNDTNFRGVVYKEDALPDELYLPFFSLHLGSIFAGDILLFDVNFFENKEPTEGKDDLGNTIYFYDKDGDGKYNAEIDVITSTTSASSQLRGIVSSWYYRLRSIAIIASMLVLIYIGIRITFSSLNPNGKAKYKNMLMDWIVSICLIFCMHYVMLFSVKLVEYATDFINSTSNEGGVYLVMMEPSSIMKDNLEEMGYGPDSGYYVDGGSVRTRNRCIFISNKYVWIYKNDVTIQCRIYICWICNHLYNLCIIHTILYIYIFTKGNIYGISYNDSTISCIDISN